MIKYYVFCFLISMVPIIELRGAIPFATSWGLMQFDRPWTIVLTYTVCILGNMLPVPFIYLFARKVLEWGSDKKIIGKVCTFFLEKGSRAGEKITSKAGRGAFIGLLLFVGIPLPGTGAWTGTLAASLLNMKFKDSVWAIMLGVLLAGLIMLAGSLGVFTAVTGLFS